MSSSESNKKNKRLQQNTKSTTNPESSISSNKNESGRELSGPVCPLLAKDSEWVDILQLPTPSAASSSNVGDDEAVLQIADWENSPEMKPLAIMFPGLIAKDPQTLQGVLNKAMSTTEVTKHLVDLGEKANFTYMKQSNRLIPKNKIWLESVPESNSQSSFVSTGIFSIDDISSDYEADNEVDDCIARKMRNKKRKKYVNRPDNIQNDTSSIETIYDNIDTLREDLEAQLNNKLINS